MRIEFNEAKREWSLRERGLDFAKTDQIFDHYALTHEDLQEDYGGDRYLTLGVLDGQVVVCVWT